MAVHERDDVPLVDLATGERSERGGDAVEGA